MTQRKSISVAMCTYNGEHFIKEQLESIARQTRLPEEIVICDDRSSDRTIEIIQAFAQTAPFSVRLSINEQNLGSQPKGITRNCERAVSLCTGELIFPCDQDDIWLPEKTATMAAMLENDSRIGGVFTDGQLVTQDGQPKGALLSEATGLNARDRKRLGRGDALPVLLAMDKIYGSSMMFDVRLLPKILPVPPNWWFDAWVGCMVSVHARLAYIAQPLYLYRIHPNQSHSASIATTSQRIQQWKSSAQKFWEDSEPRLRELRERIAAENDPHLRPDLDYVEGRMALLRNRAELSSNRLRRAGQVITQTGNYLRYFNGWRSIVKDLTA
jgi:glycosyltransferase involved in cell wall biosynthesis